MTPSKVVLVVLLLAIPSLTGASWCEGPTPSKAERYESNKHVFVAKIVAAKVVANPQTKFEHLALEYEVLELLKGDPTKVTIVGSSAKYSDYSDYRGVQVGAVYLVFSNGDRPARISMCSGTQLLSWDEKYRSASLQHLRELVLPSAN